MVTSETELRDELESVRTRLAEAEEVLRAIRDGEVDAMVVSGPDGEQIYTLQTAERPYRLLIEAMNEGAITLNDTGLILFCNHCFAEMLERTPEEVVGSYFGELVAERDHPLFEALLGKAREGTGKGELALIKKDGSILAVHVSLSTMPLDDLPGVSVVVTDLTEPKRQAEMIASANLANSILEHAAEAMVVCDGDGRIIHANRRTHQLCGTNPMLAKFDAMFHLERTQLTPHSGDVPAGSTNSELNFDGMRHERSLRGVEVLYTRRDGALFHLLLSAGAVTDGRNAVLGWVINLTSISELKDAERERERLLLREQAARREAEESNRLKDEFLATVSHELRTPLNAMLGWSRLLRVGGLEDGAIERAIEVIERNARAQNQLIDDLLDVSRIITGNLRLDVRRIDALESVKAALEAVRPAAEAKNIELEFDPQTDTSFLLADSARLQQIIWNLLSNAIKFTPHNGKTAVTLLRTDTVLEITVDDSGSGINEEFLPFVFDRFRQADGTSTRRHGGLGLGLAIVRQLVELHGGTVRVSSSGVLGGASFTVRLPLRPVAGRSESPIARGSSIAEASAVPTEGSELAGVKILVIDDEADSLELLEISLRRRGALVATANSTPAGLAVVESFHPHVILSDLGMPDEDGYEFIRKLRTRPAADGGGIPAIALTAYARDEDRRRAIAAGYQMHVAKPVELPDLLSTIVKLVRPVN